MKTNVFLPAAAMLLDTTSSFSQLLAYPSRCSQQASTSTRWMSSSSTPESSNYGADMDQMDMMESDLLIVVDPLDVNVDSDAARQVSKRQAHEFSSDQPRGILHRAFSFFLFNQDNKLLLTRRADSKITFPSVWTNTCCSHPLRDMVPNEEDIVPDAYPNFPGIKHAARRKLKHELGIHPKYILHDKVQFISRFHYWASDVKTYGDEAPWGEHEVDYVLFYKYDDKNGPPLEPNPDEVAEWKYVTIDELKAMYEDPTLLWSPWFLGIMERGGFDWWQDMDNTMKGLNTNDNVPFFDLPREYWAKYNLDSHSRTTGVLQTPAGKDTKTTIS